MDIDTIYNMDCLEGMKDIPGAFSRRNGRSGIRLRGLCPLIFPDGRYRKEPDPGLW